MNEPREDPGLRYARREALGAGLTWLAALIYTVGYCSLFAYDRPPESLTFVFGFPDWIFWGVVLPWCVCVLLSWCFAYFFIKDERFTDDPGDEETPNA